MSSKPADNVALFMPSVGYYRRALRSAKTKDKAAGVGLALAAEFERVLEWIAEQGLSAPKFRVLESEAADKPWYFETDRSSGVDEFESGGVCVALD